MKQGEGTDVMHCPIKAKASRFSATLLTLFAANNFNTASISVANFVGSVVGVLNVLAIRLRSLLLAASLSFELEVV